LQSFLEEITLDTEREEEEENAGNAVTLITMHSCKGLEFPHVSIVGLEEGLLPHSRSKTEGTLDEERRLFYVAITRAMQTLTISYCTGRKKYGQIVRLIPPRFSRTSPRTGRTRRRPIAPAGAAGVRQTAFCDDARFAGLRAGGTLRAALF
jgi:superfamily I DNA/RNA helicase